MNLSLRIALRYIFSFRAFHFITFITIISIIGIVIGVAALICVTSIFNGFGEFTEQQLIGLDPHIRVIPAKGAWLKDYPKVISELKKNSLINAITPVISGRIIIIKNGNMKVSQLNGYFPEEFTSVSGINKSMVAGHFILKNDNINEDCIILGSNLAYSLKALPGDNVMLMSLKMVENSVKTMSQNNGIPAKVTGIFQTNNPEYDDAYGYCSINTSSLLFNPPENNASAIDIRLNKSEDAQDLIKKLQPIYPNLLFQSWYDLHKDLYNILKFERVSVFIVLSLIIVIAVFNVLASLSMTVVEKRADIALLKAIGATDLLIKKIFIRTGLIIGFLSTFIGAGIGMGLCYSQIFWGWIKLSGGKYLLSTLPVTISYSDVIIIISISMILSLVTTIYPSARAASTKIIDSIRAE